MEERKEEKFYFLKVALLLPVKRWIEWWSTGASGAIATTKQKSNYRDWRFTSFLREHHTRSEDMSNKHQLYDEFLANKVNYFGGIYDHRFHHAAHSS